MAMYLGMRAGQNKNLEWSLLRRAEREARELVGGHGADGAWFDGLQAVRQRRLRRRLLLLRHVCATR
jgi:hypothetical protein